MRACVHLRLRACARECFYCAREFVFQSVFENVYVCFCLPVLFTVSLIVLCFSVCV